MYLRSTKYITKLINKYTVDSHQNNEGPSEDTKTHLFHHNVQPT